MKAHDLVQQFQHCFIRKNSPKDEPIPLSWNKLDINTAESSSLRFYLNDEYNTYSLPLRNTCTKKLDFLFVEVRDIFG